MFQALHSVWSIRCYRGVLSGGSQHHSKLMTNMIYPRGKEGRCGDIQHHAPVPALCRQAGRGWVFPSFSREVWNLLDRLAATCSALATFFVEILRFTSRIP